MYHTYWVFCHHRCAESNGLMGTNLDDGSGIYSTKLRKIDIASVFLDDCLIDKGRKKEKKEKKNVSLPSIERTRDKDISAMQSGVEKGI